MPKELFDPWRVTLDIPEVEIVVAQDAALEPGRTTIALDPYLTQAEARSTLTHELVHLARGILPHCVGGYGEVREERLVERIAARLLVRLEDLFDALRWTRGEVTCETAEECVVDLPMLLARVDALTSAERAALHEFFTGDGWER